MLGAASRLWWRHWPALHVPAVALVALSLIGHGDRWRGVLAFLNFPAGTWMLASQLESGGVHVSTLLATLTGLAASCLWTLFMLRGLHNAARDGRFRLRGVLPVLGRGLAVIVIFLAFMLPMKAAALGSPAKWLPLVVGAFELLAIAGLWLVPVVVACGDVSAVRAIGRTLVLSVGHRSALLGLAAFAPGLQLLALAAGGNIYGSGASYLYVVGIAVLGTSWHACLLKAVHGVLADAVPANIGSDTTDDLAEVFR